MSERNQVVATMPKEWAAGSGATAEVDAVVRGLLQEIGGESGGAQDLGWLCVLLDVAAKIQHGPMYVLCKDMKALSAVSLSHGKPLSVVSPIAASALESRCGLSALSMAAQYFGVEKSSGKAGTDETVPYYVECSRASLRTAGDVAACLPVAAEAGNTLIAHEQNRPCGHDGEGSRTQLAASAGRANIAKRAGGISDSAPSRAPLAPGPPPPPPPPAPRLSAAHASVVSNPAARQHTWRQANKPFDRDIDIDSALLLQGAIERRFTRHGEIWAEELAALAREHYGMSAQVTGCGDGHAIVAHLMKGLPVLMPYDCDRDHRPCFKSGHKAHWALLKGVFLPEQMSALEALPLGNESICRVDPRVCLQFFPRQSPRRPEQAMCIEVPSHVASCFVIVQHGKSKHAGVWPLAFMLESARQLTDVPILEDWEDPAALQDALDTIRSTFLLADTCILLDYGGAD